MADTRVRALEGGADGGGGIRTHSGVATEFTVRPGSPAPALPRGEASILEAGRGRIGRPGSTSNSEYFGPPRVRPDRDSTASAGMKPASSTYEPRVRLRCMSVHNTARRGFASAAGVYEESRPGYPAEAIEWLRAKLQLGPEGTLVDLAAGTGKLTRLLTATGATVIAIEPVEEMRDALRSTTPDADAREGTSPPPASSPISPTPSASESSTGPAPSPPTSPAASRSPTPPRSRSSTAASAPRRPAPPAATSRSGTASGSPGRAAAGP